MMEARTWSYRTCAYENIFISLHDLVEPQVYLPAIIALALFVLTAYYSLLALAILHCPRYCWFSCSL